MIQYDGKPSAGQLLISEPFMLDPNFKRTVILLCEHDEESGTVGFILNKSLDVRVCDALLDFDVVTNELFYGGPVAQDTLHYLHMYGDKIEDSLHISDNIYWGGNFEQLGDLLRDGLIDPNGVKFFLGYSGWSPGQLHEEMIDKSWIIAQATGKYVFETARNELWKKVLTDLGGEHKLITNYPEDPRLN